MFNAVSIDLCMTIRMIMIIHETSGQLIDYLHVLFALLGYVIAWFMHGDYFPISIIIILKLYINREKLSTS